MTPDDWRKGMENEAASVNDGVWRLETRLAARQFPPRSLLWDGLLSAGLLLLNGYVYIALVASLLRFTLRMDTAIQWTAQDPLIYMKALYELNITAVPLGCALLLGLLRVRPGVVIATFALAPLVFPLATLIYQAFHPAISYPTGEGQFTLDLMGYTAYRTMIWSLLLSTALAGLGAWLGNLIHASLFRLFQRRT